MSRLSRWKQELEKIRLSSAKKMLKPEAVVEAARAKSSPLHSKFEWDDTKAAHKYRLQQAAELIRVVTVQLDNAGNTGPMYISLSTDRISGAGYRATIDVLNDKQMLAIMIKDARSDMETFTKRYDRLRLLVQFKDIFKATAKLLKTPA